MQTEIAVAVLGVIAALIGLIAAVIARKKTIEFKHEAPPPPPVSSPAPSAERPKWSLGGFTVYNSVGIILGAMVGVCCGGFKPDDTAGAAVGAMGGLIIAMIIYNTTHHEEDKKDR